MSSPAVELQDAILAALLADAGVAAIVGAAIYDDMPPDAAYPCITFGASDTVPDDMECITGRADTMQIDCWSRDGGRLWKCRELVDAVKSALHLADLSLPTHALALIEVTLTRVFLDRDEKTAHGVVQVTAQIEEN